MLGNAGELDHSLLELMTAAQVLRSVDEGHALDDQDLALRFTFLQPDGSDYTVRLNKDGVGLFKFREKEVSRDAAPTNPGDGDQAHGPGNVQAMESLDAGEQAQVERALERRFSSKLGELPRALFPADKPVPAGNIREFSVTIDPPSVEELVAEIRELHGADPLEALPRYDDIDGYAIFLELPFLERYYLLQWYHAVQKDSRHLKLLTALQRFEAQHFLAARPLLRANDSPLFDYPPEELQRVLSKESDRVIAMLYAMAPVPALRTAIDGFEDVRAARIFGAAERIEPESIEEAVYRDVEQRVLEMLDA